MAKYFLDTEFHEYEKQQKLFGFNIGKPTPTIDLISIGIVDTCGGEFYAVNKEFDVEAAWNNEWLRENVLRGIFYEMFRKLPIYEKTHYSDHIKFNVKGVRVLLNKFGKCKSQIATDVFLFCGEKPEFYAYYADYDWVTFAWLFGRMIDLPKGFPMYCRDLKQMLDELDIHAVNKYPNKNRTESWLEDVKKLPNYPKQENEHNALADAKWNKSLYEFIKNIDKEILIGQQGNQIAANAA